ncbi:GroES-like protein [Epithele typhae]|uniref:GroES-like protein n=1 Tax=Epithele typhae TaxID=378194 RepID=UPI00200746C7|nr:GroES-like protein [Epithele typhae]KAH9918189.1 GroES-like protein [Epithele typhae]
MAPTTQKALVIPAEKAAFKLLTDYPVATPEADEVLVKVAVTAICPAEWKIQTYGAPFLSEYPFIGGLDVAGIVEEVGASVQNVKKGGKIVCPGGFQTRHAGFKEYTIALAEHIPENVTFAEAVSVPLGLATAITPLYAPEGPDSLGLPAPWEPEGTTKFAGKPALIVGGSTSVGQYAIQVARMAGFAPILTTAAPKHADALRALGATHVLDRALAPSSAGGVALAYEAVGDEESQRLAYAALAAHAAAGFVSVTPGAPPEVLAAVAEDGDGKRVARAFSSLEVPQNRAVGREVFARLEGWLRDGTVKPNRVEVLVGLEAIPEGVRRVKEGKVSGVKLVVKVAEDL